MLFGNGFTSVIGFGMAYIIYHNLPLAASGIWYFSQSLVAMCEAGRYGLLSTAAVKFYAGTQKERAQTVLGSIWFLAIALTAIVLAINAGALLVLPYTTNYETIVCIKWVGLNFLSSLPADVVFWRLQADEEYTKMFWFRMINSCSTILSFVALALFHDFTLENVLIYNFITNCTSSLIGIIWYRSGIQYITKRSRECIMEILHFGKYTFGTTLFANFLGNSDIWILNFVLGPASVAIYNLAMRLMAFIELPLRSFATTGMSEMAIAYNADNQHQVGYLFRKYSGMLTVAFVPITVFAIIVANVVIQILGGHQFDGASGALAANAYRFIMILSISYPIDRFNGLALDITHHTRTNMIKMVIVVSLKIVVGFIATDMLESLFGVIIANYAATAAAIIYGHIQLRKYLPHTIPGIIKTGYKEFIAFVSIKYNVAKKNT